MTRQPVRIEWTVKPVTLNNDLYLHEQSHYGADIYHMGANGQPESPLWEDSAVCAEELMTQIKHAYEHDWRIMPEMRRVARTLMVTIHSAVAVDGYYPPLKTIVRQLSGDEWNEIAQ